ncbi:GMC oxidoreductase [Paraglaciecola hydrolytica]|uniref:GMC family oxidoreductase n=1 Tax=Paraglaciecola hydrolytica TaxID=1799789 RepID=A0A135ZZS6_9ALTE|nr:GMC family oxidoreductase [Paraglaciecola hydrolytica]KXI28481.1 GMC family oxidoreductase [Paraglaciecola hydrolytica]
MQNEQMYIKESQEIYDAIVVGSGVAGGWAAKELCEKGQKTLMIERGRIVEHRKDYIGENKAPWQQEYRTRVDNLLLEQQYKIQQQCYAFKDATKHFFGNDRDLPYNTPKDKPFSWIRANQLGGKSLLWHRQSYRFSDYDFAANSLDGYGNDWPVRYQDIADWYSYVEKHAGISGNADNLPQLPNSDFLPPFEMNSPEKAIKAKLEALFPKRNLIMGRAAHLTKPTELHYSQGRVQCQARNECQAGCSFGAYFSTQSSTLPAAAKTGLLHIAPDSVVHSLIYDEQKNRVVGVRVIDNNDLSQREYFAKVVFLCASTLGSTQILLNSATKTQPKGLANSSGVLGHYLMDHNYNANAGGDVEGFEDEIDRGRRPTGILVPNFYYQPDAKRKFLRGYMLGGSAYRENWQSSQYQDGIGVDFKNKLKQAGKWKFGLYAMGEMLPRFENHVALHPTLKDKWGMPQLDIHCEYSENEKLMMEDAKEQMTVMLEAVGVTNISAKTSDKPPGLAIHEVGTARMGRDPKTSVLNSFNQSHNIPNLFVTDGASFCSTAPQNPSLSFMAFTARAVDYALKEQAAGRL